MSDVLRRALFVLVAVMLYGAAGAWLSTIVPADAQSEPTELEAQAREAVETFFGAVMTGDSDKVAAVIAPEFQLQRSNGMQHTADSYSKSDLPVIDEMPVIDQLVVTGDDDLVIATYAVTIDETIDGKVVQARAPRMTVFRKVDGAWLVAAHANFATTVEQ